jgi:integrase
MRRPKTTGTVVRNASGTWRARLHAPDGGRVSLGSYRTKSEAERALAAAVGEQVKGSWVNPTAGRILFRVYATDWVAQRAALRPRTRELYESQLRVHLLPAFGEMHLGQILPMHVRRWYSSMERNARPGPVTRAKVYRLLRSILKTAVEDNLIVRNPCAINGAGIEKSAERPVATVEQVDELAAAIDRRYRALVYLATYATLRYGELFALRRRHIDLEQRTVTVVEQVVRLADGTIVFGPPKTHAGRRVVSLPMSLVPEIQRHLDDYVPDDPDAFVFRGPKGALPEGSNWNRMWRKLTSSVGVEGLHFHDLRHTGNTLSASTGASTKELMARMGHASSRAALIYQHASRERDEAIAAGLDAILTSRTNKSHAPGSSLSTARHS